MADQRSIVVLTRFRREDLERLDEAARADRRTRADFLRAVVLDYLDGAAKEEPARRKDRRKP